MTNEYLAGFFDGEGTIFISQQGPKGASFNLRAAIAQKQTGQVRVLEEIRNFLGYGKIDYNKSEKLSQLYFNVEDTISFLKKILPYLVVKNSQARLGLQFAKYKKDNRGRGKYVSTNELRWRNMHYELMKLYKHL